MELDDGTKTDVDSGSENRRLYTVEARYNAAEPRVLCGNHLDTRWRRLVFQHNNPRSVLTQSRYENYYRYEVAQALRWWFHANAAEGASSAWSAWSVSSIWDVGAVSHCLETRLIEHKLESNYTITAVSQHCHVTYADRSNIAPDWEDRRNQTSTETKKGD